MTNSIIQIVKMITLNNQLMKVCLKAKILISNNKSSKTKLFKII